MTHQINISFTKENKLKIILDDKLLDPNLKLCFSLVYSIKSISGGEITKQIGRYYELSIKKIQFYEIYKFLKLVTSTFHVDRKVFSLSIH